MTDHDWMVLRTLADSPRCLFRDEKDKRSLGAMALYIARPVSDVYEMPDGSMIAKITDKGRRMLAERDR